MQPGKTAIERAFDLAKNGKVSTLTELRLATRKEGYATDQLDGPMLTRQLRGILKDKTSRNP